MSCLRGLIEWESAVEVGCHLDNRTAPTISNGAQQRQQRPGSKGGQQQMDDKAERAQERADFKRVWKSVMDLGALMSMHCIAKSVGRGLAACFGGHARGGILASRRCLPNPSCLTYYNAGASQLTGYEKKMYEARRIVELGGKVRSTP